MPAAGPAAGLLALQLLALWLPSCAATGLRSHSAWGRHLTAAPGAGETGPAILAAAASQLRPPPPLRRQALRPSPSPPVPRPRWVLLWEDGFNGTALDGGKWEALQGDGSAFGIPGW